MLHHPPGLLRVYSSGSDSNGLISNSRSSNPVQCSTQKCLKPPRIFIVRPATFVLDGIFYKRVGEFPSPAGFHARIRQYEVAIDFWQHTKHVVRRGGLRSEKRTKKQEQTKIKDKEARTDSKWRQMLWLKSNGLRPNSVARMFLCQYLNKEFGTGYVNHNRQRFPRYKPNSTDPNIRVVHRASLQSQSYKCIVRLEYKLRDFFGCPTQPCLLSLLYYLVAMRCDAGEPNYPPNIAASSQRIRTRT